MFYHHDDVQKQNWDVSTPPDSGGETEVKKVDIFTRTRIGCFLLNTLSSESGSGLLFLAGVVIVAFFVVCGILYAILQAIPFIKSIFG